MKEAKARMEKLFSDLVEELLLEGSRLMEFSLEEGEIRMRFVDGGGYTLIHYDPKVNEVRVLVDWGSYDFFDRWVVTPTGVKYTGTVDGSRYLPVWLARVVEDIPLLREGEHEGEEEEVA